MTRILLVYPRFPSHTYWSFSSIMPFIGAKATMPPLGLVTVAALLPADCEVRLVDMNIEPLLDAHLCWADLVMTSTMIVQAASLDEVLARARALGVPALAGGPHPSASPEAVPLADHLLLGEAEAVLPEFLADWRAGRARRVYAASGMPEITDAPLPRLDLLKMDAYASMSVQYSRGCPFSCEFCNIWKLYGRRARNKEAGQWFAELDRLHGLGWRGAVFVVDDNFIGRPAEVKRMLSSLVEWQAQRGYPFQFFTEASVNAASDPELLRLLREAGFTSLFLGIESPSAESLESANKGHNLRLNLRESVRAIHAAGIEVMGGFIVGFDQDGPDIFDRQIEFIQQTGIPMAMVGLLLALPGTDLYHRLERDGRIVAESSGNNTHLFTTNYRPVMDPVALSEGYQRIIRTLYAPDLKSYFDRCRILIDELGPNPLYGRRVGGNEWMAFVRTLRHLAGQSYAPAFLRFLAWALVRHPRRFAEAVRLGLVGHHFQWITGLAVEHHRLNADLATALDEGVGVRLARLRRRLQRMPAGLMEECVPLYHRVVEKWHAARSRPTTAAPPSLQLERLRERLNMELDTLRVRCQEIHRDAAADVVAIRQRTRLLERDSQRILRELRRQVSALPRDYRLLALFEHGKARMRIEEMLTLPDAIGTG